MVKVPLILCAVRVATWALLTCAAALLCVVAALAAAVAYAWLTAKLGAN